jgi:hypothetical protein
MASSVSVKLAGVAAEVCSERMQTYVYSTCVLRFEIDYAIAPAGEFDLVLRPKPRNHYIGASASLSRHRQIGT